MTQPQQATVAPGTSAETRAQVIEVWRQRFLEATNATPDQALKAATELVDRAIAQRGG